MPTFWGNVNFFCGDAKEQEGRDPAFSCELAGIYVAYPRLTQKGRRRRGQTLSAKVVVENLEKVPEGMGHYNRL
jgi:hypothetical protein